MPSLTYHSEKNTEPFGFRRHVQNAGKQADCLFRSPRNRGNQRNPHRVGRCFGVSRKDSGQHFEDLIRRSF
jgi:hypothetical protein